MGGHAERQSRQLSGECANVRRGDAKPALFRAKYVRWEDIARPLGLEIDLVNGAPRG